MGRWRGKILGGLFGAVVAGPAGAAVGAGIGHLVDEKEDQGTAFSARLEGVWLRLNAMDGRIPGIAVRVSFSTEGCKEIRCGLRLRLLDGDGDPIPLAVDSDSGPTSGPREAAVIAWFLPRFDAALYDDAELFMPYSSMDLESPGSGWAEVSVVTREPPRLLARRLEKLVYPEEAILPPELLDSLAGDEETGGGVHGDSDDHGRSPAEEEGRERLPALDRSLPPLADEYLDLLHVLAGCAMADGELAPSESGIIRRFFANRLRLSDIELTQVWRELHQIGRSGPDQDAAERLADTLDEEMKRKLLDLLWRVAEVDGTATAEERAFVYEVGVDLELPVEAWNLLLPPRERQWATDLKALGLTPRSLPSREEIKKAYRGLILKYHPDRVAHLGEELQDLAHQKLVEINQAYSRLAGHED